MLAELALPLQLALAAGGALAAPGNAAWVDAYDVVWMTPSQDSSGSMPLGNGDIGLNLWVEPGGDLRLIISKTDAWSELGRLLKVGGLRVRLSPNPFAEGQPFRQELRLRQGDILVTAGDGGAQVTLRVWVDANQPAIRIEADGDSPFHLSAVLDVWRTESRELTGAEAFSAYGVSGGPEPVIEGPDRVRQSGYEGLVWYHWNETSRWPEAMRLQGFADRVRPEDDPLYHRIFGAVVRSAELRRVSGNEMSSSEPRRHFAVSVHPHTAQRSRPDVWLGGVESGIASIEAVGSPQARSAHEAWWEAFWQRSWIRVRSAGGGPTMSVTDIPLRIGADSDGANRFHGLIAQPVVLARALSAEEVAGLSHSDFPANDSAVVFGIGPAGRAVGGELEVVGELPAVNSPHGRALQFSGDGYCQIAGRPELALTSACTLSAWVRPEALPGGGARIIDKTLAGTAEGYMLDTFPGSSLRMITRPLTLTHPADLPPGEWTHVASTFDRGVVRLYVNGEQVAEGGQPFDESGIARGYALQRFINACAGRGAFPIKFNGSVFTVDSREPNEVYNADYRRWGGPYWYQNTRLPYWAMLMAGDTDLMQPYFRMYSSLLPLARERTRRYFSHEGAFFPETMTFFGLYANENYGWDRTGKPVDHVDNTYIRHYYQGGIELVATMLDYYALTGDRHFLEATLLPMAEAILSFYDQHYTRDASGHIRFEPAQSLETWQVATNPAPEIAGLRWVLPRLLALPEALVPAALRTQWRRLLGEVPELPRGETPEGDILLPAETFSALSNIENPELYAIFPYRHFGIGKPDLDLARRTYAARRVRGSAGWQQDPIQAALLGLTEEAAAMVSQRFANTHPGSRFPAFWGPNFDWVPDQDNGGVGMIALQRMLMQCDGDRILLFPAWPKDWDVDFRLHAPHRTTVEGTLRAGRLERLVVRPAERAGDVEVLLSDD